MRGRIMRRPLVLAAAAALCAAALGACGGGGSSPTVAERESDAAVLNEVLGRQLAAVAAYERVLPGLSGSIRAAATRFRAQEQEHVDATTKTLRRIGGESDPPAESIEVDDLETRADSLEFLYRMESATIDLELSAVGRLSAAWPRPLVASMAASQAERLVLLRRALGAEPLAVVPSAFENGEIPAPERKSAK